MTETNDILEFVTRYDEPLDLDIDLLALDEEWVRQPRMYLTAARKAADAAAEVDRAKSNLAVVRAEEELAARSNPEAYGLEKATDNAVKAAVEACAAVRAAEARLNKARHNVGVLNAAVDALEHKKRALEGIVTLQGREQYATPRAPQNPRGEEMTVAETRAVRQRAIKHRAE